MKLPLSVIILTYNEELNMRACLASISDFAGEIIIIDSFSTDKTLDIVAEFGIKKVFQHSFKNQAQQFNWALDNVPIENNWILRLDADEQVLLPLVEEMQKTLKNVSDDVSGFFLRRRVYFMGKWIRHGGYYPTWMLRLFRKGKARCEDREMDEHIVVSDGEVLKLKNDFVDNDRKSLERWVAKHNDFSTREARERLREYATLRFGSSFFGTQAERKKWIKRNLYGRVPKFFRAFAYFIYRYIFLFGFLDGKEGLIFHVLQGLMHQFLIDAKMYEAVKKKT